MAPVYACFCTVVRAVNTTSRKYLNLKAVFLGDGLDDYFAELLLAFQAFVGRTDFVQRVDRIDDRAD